jgi:hypothetical protein
MRFILAAVTLALVSCAQLQRNTSEMTAEQMLQRSTHVFIGVIEKHEYSNKFLFRVSGEGSEHWRVMDRKVRVEMVLRGSEPRSVIDIYEAIPPGGANANSNSTNDGSRYLFPVRVENGRYHLVRDLLRSIYPVDSGRHDRLPLEDSRPFWERFALLQWQVQPDRSGSFGKYWRTDPALVFGEWRRAKVLRGLLRHADADLRLAACEDLLNMRIAQDECWDTLAPTDRRKLTKFNNVFPPEAVWNTNRAFETRAHRAWDQLVDRAEPSFEAMNKLRLLTTINNSKLRREFCANFQKRFPDDHENGCPADQPPPPTIVTEKGDVPLIGDWPKP